MHHPHARWMALAAILVLALPACAAPDASSEAPVVQAPVITATPVPAPTATVEQPTDEPPSPTPTTEAPQASPQPTPGPPLDYDPANLGDMQFSLLDTLTVASGEGRDYEKLQVYMPDPFTLYEWDIDETSRLTPPAAAEQLRTRWLPPEGVMSYRLDADIDGLLGVDPKSLFGSGVRFVYADGWGEDGDGEAILVLSRYPGDVFVWEAVIVSEDGF